MWKWLRQFISRCGNPKEIYSDNGTNFVRAVCLLRESLQKLNQEKINQFSVQQGINLFFNSPGTSHMRGAWERMVCSIRHILDTLLETQSPTDEAFNTLMAEVEGILNSGPLVPITIDPQSDEPLTPNHLLLLRGNANLPPDLFDKKDCYAKNQWAQIRYLSCQFWSRWLKEFLPNLTQWQKWIQTHPNVQKEDVVLVVDSMQHHSKWLLG